MYMIQFAYGANLNDVIWLRESKLYNLDSIEKKFKKGYPIRQVRDVYSVLTTKYGVQNKFPYITGNNICISSRAPILTYDKACSLTMVFVDITTRSTATYEEIENNVDIAKGMANARISGVKSLRAVNKDGKLHYAQYAIGQGHIRISYNVDKQEVRMALENYVMGIALSSFNKGITITDITDEANIYCVIDNTGRSEDDVETLAKELKVQLIVATKISLHKDIEITVKFKSVPHDVYVQTQRDVIERYRNIIQENAMDKLIIVWNEKLMFMPGNNVEQTYYELGGSS